MCMEDLAMGRKKVSATRQITFAAGVDAPLLTPSVDRTHFRVQSTTAGLRFVPQPLTSVGTPCYFSDSIMGGVEFDIETHGDIVQQGWVGSGNGGSALVIITETFFIGDQL